MATEAATPLPDGEQFVAAAFACEACGAGMRADQDWCLECGTAAPGRLGARPGWRAAFTVIGLTLLLLTGAVAASYAALTGDAQREAAKPSPGSGNPITAQTPGLVQPATPVTPGATGPGTTGPGTTVPPAAAPSVGTPLPSQAPTVAPRTNTPGAGGTGASPSSTAKKPAAKTGPAPIKLSSGAASLYDPAGRPGAEFGPARNAVDGSASTVWDVTVPVDGEPLGVGLVIDLGAPYALASLTLSTPTSGFDVELYGTRTSKLPPDILDERWSHLTQRSNYADGKPIALKGRGDGKVRFLNMWFVEAADDKDPRVAIGNVKVVGRR